MIWIAALLAVAVAATAWFRDSSLVAVKRVAVVGATGPDAERVTQALEQAARDMTTLHVREDQLRAVARPYPMVKDLKVTTDFPHGLRIQIEANMPVALVAAGDTETPVAPDGRLLRGAEHGPLPVLPLNVAPGARLADRDATEALAAVAAAPLALRQRVERAVVTREHGLVLDLRDGPQLRFGGADRLTAKWAATAAVLADERSAGAMYLDVRYPERPAAGGLEDTAAQTNPAAVPEAATPSSSVPAPAIAGTTP